MTENKNNSVEKVESTEVKAQAEAALEQLRKEYEEGAVRTSSVSGRSYTEAEKEIVANLQKRGTWSGKGASGEYYLTYRGQFAGKCEIDREAGTFSFPVTGTVANGRQEAALAHIKKLMEIGVIEKD